MCWSLLTQAWVLGKKDSFLCRLERTVFARSEAMDRLLSVLYVISWFLRGTSFSKLRVNIGTFALEKPVVFGALYYLRPAYEMGVDDVRALYGAVLNVSHTYIANSSIGSCDPEFVESVEDMVAKFYYETAATADVTVFVSPGCNELSSTNALATQWNVLHVATVSDIGYAKNRSVNPVWLSLAAASFASTRDAMVELLLRYQWNNTFVVWETSSNPIYRGLSVTVVGALRKMKGMQTTLRSINGSKASEKDQHDLLNDFRRSSRVMLYSGHSDYLRKLLIRGTGLNMTNGEYVYIGFQTPFHIGTCGNFSWEFGDADDEVAKLAYRSVLVLGAERLDNQTEADRADPIMQYWKRQSFDMYNFTYSEPVLSELYTENSSHDFSDGKSLANRFLGRSFRTKVMDVMMSPTGEIVVNLTLRAMGSVSGAMQVVSVWDSRNRAYVDVDVIDWPNGHAPANIPLCGHSGDSGACSQGFPSGAVIGGVCGAVAVLLLGVILSLRVIRARAATALLHDRLWIISDVVLVGQQESQYTVGKSQITRKHTEKPIFQRWYNGTPIWTQRLYKGYITAEVSEMITNEFDYDVQMLMLEMRGCNHFNINRFFGIFISIHNGRHTMNAVTAFCSRGSMCDLFEVREVDWDFRISFLSNLVSGMAYIHSGPLGFHGNLTSGKCLVDRYFTLKLTGYGYNQVLANIDSRIRRNRSRLSDSAPLSENGQAHNLCKEHDIFTLGVIMTEIITARSLTVEEPFSVVVMSKVAIVNRALSRVSDSTNTPMSAFEKALPQLVSLVHCCMDHDPTVRPDILTVQHDLEFLLGTTRLLKTTVVEKFIARLSIYSQRLESEIMTRTSQLLQECRKTDKLLREVLPSPIIERLRRGEMVAAEVFTATTIFFSDFVGFSSFVDGTSPIEVVRIVSAVINIFDSVIADFDVYKVETSGDVYMAVSGLPVRNERHADEIISMACLMLQLYYASEYSQLDLGFRAGAHAGTCAAGIVGLNRPRYCLFGDSVNVASRMCTYGESGRLQISAATAALLTKEFSNATITQRGAIAIKGRGEVVTYWIDPDSKADKDAAP